MEDNNHVDQHDDVTTIAANNNNHGWQKVTSKRQRKPIQAKPTADNQAANHFPKFGANGSNDGVFTSFEKKSEERRKLIQAQNAAIAASYETVPVRSARNIYSDDDDDSDADVGAVPNGGGVEEKKVKKPKVTVAEAAAKIDAADLSAFIADVTASYEM